MYNKKNRSRAKWVTGILIILCLTFLAAQSAYTQRYGLGDIPLDPGTYKKHLKVRPDTDTLVPLPAAYDARTEGIVTPAKDQGSCGSCWAFATVGAMESHIMKKKGSPFIPQDLSEQQLLLCNTECFGCCGGYSSAAQFWVNEGPIYETCFPYTADASCTPADYPGLCSASDSCLQLGYRTTDWHTVLQTVEGFKTSLYLDGPGYWGFRVYSDFIAFWGTNNPGAVYTQTTGSYLGSHAVLLIGWDDSKGAYLCKNSWGSGGPNGDGTFWIAYSGHRRTLGFSMSNFSVTSLGCSLDSECNDELYCNGLETCVGDTCQSGTPPACSDDGVYCNGNEVCDEGIDGCGHTGNPCGAGTICNENYDTCDSVACFVNDDCDDGDTCTTDTCSNPGTAGAVCEYVPVSPPASETDCADGIDNDCDGFTDCDDSDCDSDSNCQCLPRNASCQVNGDCCSNWCRKGICK